jgi:hypothetical protein
VSTDSDHHRLPDVVVVSRHKPHELFFFVLSIITGLAYVIASPPQGSILKELHPYLAAAWSWSLLVSGICGVVGYCWRKHAERGMEIERGALVMQVGAIGIYASALFANVGGRALFAGGIAIAWAGANAWEAWLITKSLRRIREVA